MVQALGVYVHGGLRDLDDLLTEFYHAADIETLYSKYQPYYDDIIERAIELTRPPMALMVDHFRIDLEPLRDFHILINLLDMYWRGYMFERTNIDPSTTKPILLYSGPEPTKSEINVVNIAHEFAHVFVTPILKANPPEFQSLETALVAKYGVPKTSGYSTWRQVIDESFVRAISSWSVGDSRQQMEQEVADGFVMALFVYDSINGFPDYDGDFERWVKDLMIEYTDTITAYEIELSAEPKEGGNVFGGGLYRRHEEVVVGAIPDKGYAFLHWLDHSSDYFPDGIFVTTEASFSFNALSSRKLKAVLQNEKATERHTLNASLVGSGEGTITSSPAGIDCGSACSAEFDAGTTVFLSASADRGSEFAGWGGACFGTGGCSVKMGQDQNLTATFSSDPALTAWMVAEIYLATMGYAPDADGHGYWIENIQTDPAWTPTTVAQSFFDQPLMQAEYPAHLGYGPLIEALYLNIFGRTPDSVGYSYWLGELESGRVLRNQMVIALIEGGWDNPDAATDMARFGNRIIVSLAFAEYQVVHGIKYSALSPSDQIRLRQAGRDVLEGVGSAPNDYQIGINRIPELLSPLSGGSG